MHDPAGVPDGERRAHVLAEVQLLDRDGVGRCASISTHPPAAWMSARRAPREHAALVSITPPSSAPAARFAAHDAVAGVGEPGVNSENDHEG